MADLEITSNAFEPGQPIPERCSRDNDNLSPPLEIRNPPEGAMRGHVLEEAVLMGTFSA